VPPLPQTFYARDTVTVARALLGQRLVRLLDGTRVAGRIVEVEAYVGEMDSACHAHRGRTARNATMYGPPGHAYVYFVYGMHHCVNVVTDREGYPAAVLIRALAPVEGIDTMRALRVLGPGRSERELTNGPAKLCYALSIDRALDGTDLVQGGALWIERDLAPEEEEIASGPRVGVRGDAWALNVPWRFWIRGNRYVSRG
jgi:DNA-3-methyladenine glycosylase